jgi:hypothetical protein
VKLAILSLFLAACQTGTPCYFHGSRSYIHGGVAVNTKLDDTEHPATSVYTAQADVIGEMEALYPGVKLQDVKWRPCGDENAWYSPGKQTITFCTELEALGGAAVGVAAHEFGHAITEQLTNTTSEQDADEVGALALIRLGHQTELLELAAWFKSFPNQGQGDGDEHPGAGFRADELSCIEAGSEPGATGKCKALYDGLRVRWDMRLAPENTN